MASFDSKIIIMPISLPKAGESAADKAKRERDARKWGDAIRKEIVDRFGEDKDKAPRGKRRSTTAKKKTRKSPVSRVKRRR